MKKLTIWLLVFILLINLIPTFITVVKASSSWYVAKTGLDTNDGKSIGAPFLHIQKAVNVSIAGDTIYIREGNYNEMFSTSGVVYCIAMKASGTAGNPITLTNYNGERAVINGVGVTLPSGYGLISLWSYGSVGRKYITIENLIFENSSQNGITTLYDTTSPSNNITIRNCTFNDISYCAIKSWQQRSSPQISDITISNCSFSEIETAVGSMGEGVTFYGCKNIVFQNNYMTNFYKIGVVIANNSKNVLIDRNRFNNTLMDLNAYSIYVDGGQQDLPITSTVSNVVISNNLIWGTHNGIGFTSEFTGGSIDNITIVNNIINITGSVSQYCITNFNDPAHQYDVTIKYNTLYKNGAGYPIFIRATSTYIHRFIIANNIFITGGATNYQLYCSYLDSTETDFLRVDNLYYHTSKTSNTYFNDGTNKFEASAVRTNPLFVSLGTYNYHLNSTSPAIDAGSLTYTISYDYDGNPRPYGMGYDIGAYEYNGAGSGDSTAPVISQVGVTTSSPIDTLTGYGWENFTCLVADNVGVSTVLLKLTNPDQSTTNVPMIKKTGSATYYVNQSLHPQGNYSYRIQATDTSNNVALSSSYTFSLAPNWDINYDSIITILDLVLVSNQYGNTGGHGWIREDVDNNGTIQVLDIAIVSNNFGESW
jgi:hypothetical protein